MPHDDGTGRDALPASGAGPGQLSALLRELAAVPRGQAGAAWGLRLRPGAIIGRFQLVQEIGRGGFGVVYEARDRKLGRTVAFKAVRPGDALDAREDQLLREADAAARLSHPNIVSLFDVGRSEHGPYLVLEFLRGQTLARRLDQGAMSVLESVRVAVEVAKGLAHAHQHGVVHRDLKPGNIFLCDDGQVKVLDLGLAHAFGRRRVDGGTPGYMAPEQQRGAPEDERTDVFALGVILYRMLAEAAPFPRERGRIARPARTLAVPGAPALGELISRMLEQDPVKRPRSAGEVLAALKAFLQELERTPSAATAVSVVKRRHPRVRVAALVAAGLLAGFTFAGWLVHRTGRLIPRPPRVQVAPSIAVLPFADLSPQGGQEYFADGLADEILTVLASVEGVRVPSRTSSFFFKGKSVRLAEIGKELNVGTVLEGSVRKVGNRVRVSAQIVNVGDGYQLWAQTYDRDLTDIFAVQEEVARAVVQALDAKLLGQGAPSLKGRATGNPEAYRQYLLGRQQFHRLTPEGFKLAVDAYQRALALDPGYAPAWAGLAVPLYYLADEAESPAAVAAQGRRALAAAEKAVALSPDLAEALSTRGYLRSLIERDWAGARSDLQRAVALNGNDADSRRRYGILLQEVGQLPDAIAEVRKAVDLDPLGQSWGTLGTLQQAAGDLAAAEVAFRRHLEVTPGSLPGLVAVGRNQLLQARPAEALATFERCPAEDFRLWGRAVAEHGLAHPAASQAALEALTRKYAHTSAMAIAEVHAWRGEKDLAFSWLERAVADPGGGVMGLRTDPFLRSLRDDPRFKTLLRKMNLPVD